jgi:hypothetical protein
MSNSEIQSFVSSLIDVSRASDKPMVFNESAYNKLVEKFTDYFNGALSKMIMHVANCGGTSVSVTISESIADHSTRIGFMQCVLEDVFEYTDMHVKASRNEDCSIRVEFSW